MRSPLRMVTIILLACGLFLFGPSARSLAKKHRDSIQIASNEELIRRNSNAFAVILGEFRASVSDFMFIKTERYLDSGVAYEPHITLDEMAGESEVNEEHGEHDQDQDHAHEHDHDGEDHPDSIIRTSQRDFRGFLGDLERTVKPYRDPKLPHNHTTGEELLPWYRLMTLTNPRQIRPYLIGAMWLSQEHKLDAAIEFLNEGISHNQDNPDLFRLYHGLTTAYVKKRYASKDDSSWMAPALQSARKSFELGLVQRNAVLGKNAPFDETNEQWRDDHEEDLRMAAFYVALIQHYMGDNESALKAAMVVQEIFPEYGPNNRFIASMQKQ